MVIYHVDHPGSWTTQKSERNFNLYPVSSQLPFTILTLERSEGVLG